MIFIDILYQQCVLFTSRIHNVEIFLCHSDSINLSFAIMSNSFETQNFEYPIILINLNSQLFWSTFFYCSETLQIYCWVNVLLGNIRFCYFLFVSECNSTKRLAS